ncbi:MAG: hypothetical protein OK438_00520 [Thaumarchaeota archaeon]|nr:hypothetical protein [Nitrososphaerota archaeon]
MMQEVQPLPLPGLVKFESMQSLTAYLKTLLLHYERECDLYGVKVGDLMRILEKEPHGKNLGKMKETGWKKVGMIMVNTKESKVGTLELMIEVMEDYKAKANRTREVLTNIDELEDLGVPKGASLILYLRHGVPLRIVVDEERNAQVDALLTTKA